MKNFLGAKPGFSFIELILFTALFFVASIMFMSILISVTRVQVHQSATTEVGQQSLFVLQNIQRYIEESSFVEEPQNPGGPPASSLKLRMPTAAEDPTYIYLNSGIVYVGRTAVPAQSRALSTNKVNVPSLEFVKHSNPGAHDSVSVAFTMTASTPQQQFSQQFSSAVTRARAATFDTNVLPPTTNPNLKLGATGATWQSINDIIYFLSGNVGIGIPNPTAKLDVSGAVKIDGSMRLMENDVSELGVCSASTHGTMYLIQGSAGVSSTIQVCLLDQGGTPFWAKLRADR